MHLIYRSKKQPLPLPDNKITPYSPLPPSQLNSTHEIFRKKSIDIVFDKHPYPLNINEAAMIYNPPQRKTFYRRSKSKKSESTYIKGNTIYE